MYFYLFIFEYSSEGRGQEEGAARTGLALGEICGSEGCPHEAERSTAQLPLRIWCVINKLSCAQEEDGLSRNK